MWNTGIMLEKLLALKRVLQIFELWIPNKILCKIILTEVGIITPRFVNMAVGKYP